MSGHEVPMCRAMSDPRRPVTVYLAGLAYEVITARMRGSGRGKWFACTQDRGHDYDHAACDGKGHILARWPRAADERYWTARAGASSPASDAPAPGTAS